MTAVPRLYKVLRVVRCKTTFLSHPRALVRKAESHHSDRSLPTKTPRTLPKDRYTELTHNKAPKFEELSIGGCKGCKGKRNRSKAPHRGISACTKRRLRPGYREVCRGSHNKGFMLRASYGF